MITKLLKIIILTGLVLLLATSLFGQKKRKLPKTAYINSIKIEQMTGRHENALIMIDSLFFHFGLSPEGISLLSKSLVSLFYESDKKEEKISYLDEIYAFSDSLALICSDENIGRFSPDSCKTYIKELDSLKSELRNKLYDVKK